MSMLGGGLREGLRAMRGIVLMVAAMVALPAFAAGPAPAGPAVAPGATLAGNDFGLVWRISGEIWATDLRNSQRRVLRQGDAVRVGERLESGDKSEAVLTTRDAGLIALRPRSVFYAEAYVAQGKPKDRMALRLLKGSLRVITGWISVSNRDGYSLRTPSVTVGVRGTDHETYVLVQEDAKSGDYLPGSYDKVNRGGTIMTTVAGSVDVDAGRVGFARQVGQASPAGAGKDKDKAMLTLLLPVLLERVPDFYVGGRFEQEIDAFSSTADENARRKLEEELAAQQQAQRPPCKVDEGAREWIQRFDAMIQARDGKSVLAMFAEDASIRIVVRDGEGSPVENSISRQDFVRSVEASLAALEDYSQERRTLEVGELPPVQGQACARAQLRSHVVEQGRMAGAPYRAEADETYVLEWREGQWLAVESLTVQR